MIQTLENQLEEEKKRRDLISKSFKEQMKEFEEEKIALENLRNATVKMERNQQEVQKHKAMLE